MQVREARLLSRAHVSLSSRERADLVELDTIAFGLPERCLPASAVDGATVVHDAGVRLARAFDEWRQERLVPVAYMLCDDRGDGTFLYEHVSVGAMTVDDDAATARPPRSGGVVWAAAPISSVPFVRPVQDRDLRTVFPEHAIPREVVDAWAACRLHSWCTPGDLAHTLVEAEKSVTGLEEAAARLRDTTALDRHYLRKLLDARTSST